MNIDLYEQDFYRWTMSNARLLRQGRFSEIDAENIAEELESMGRSEKRELVDRLAVLLAHLLKWELQPRRRSRSWEKTILEQRRKIELLLEDSPSLEHEVTGRMERAYKLALKEVAKETGLPPKDLPRPCPYSFEETVDDDFWPGA